ncbi:MAG TPA: DUF3299 domain-containing protein [Casimicrobiaceae bacterium]|jgi:hypothetical protein
MTTKYLHSLLILLCAVSVRCAYADDAPRPLTWEDLTVRMTATENPFAALPIEQLEALVDVAALRDRKARGVAVSSQDLANEQAATDKLKRAGIDVDALLAKRDEVAAKKRALTNAVNPALDGKVVRIPGYLLPLEFSGKQVTEFLLVPWVGACIRTPPPPPNQIVHVRSDKPFEMKGMFDAVWVTGRIAAATAKKSVYITDGSSEVDVGYSLRASQIERY